MKDQRIKRPEDRRLVGLIYRFIDLSTYGHCRGEHALEEGGQEVAPSQEALTGEAGPTKATTAQGKEAFAAKCRAQQVADGELKRKKARSILELLEIQRNEAPRLPIQSPLRWRRRRVCARCTHHRPLSRPIHPRPTRQHQPKNTNPLKALLRNHRRLRRRRRQQPRSRWRPRLSCRPR